MGGGGGRGFAMRVGEDMFGEEIRKEKEKKRKRKKEKGKEKEYYFSL